MNTPLSSFTALVKFQFDRAGLTSEIAKVRSQLQSLSTTQDKAAKKREQSSARAFISEMRMQRTHAKALRENEAFDRKRQNNLDDWHRKREREEQNAASAQNKRDRDRQAQQLRAAREQSREAARRMREMITQANFQNREYNLQRRRDAQMHSEALRENARRDAELRRSLRQNRPHNTPTNSQGGNTNPWHIGTMAGGLGGLITRGNLAAVGAGAFTQQSFTQANFDIAQAPQFEFITGSAAEAAKQVAFLNKEVDRLSLPLRETSDMYRQLLASTKKGLGIEKTQELFSSFSDISTMLGLSSDAQQRGLRAFAQMAS